MSDNRGCWHGGVTIGSTQESELAQWRKMATDPAAVWQNIITGRIARPQALDHYEECKAAVERLETKLECWKKGMSYVIGRLRKSNDDRDVLVKVLESHHEGYIEAAAMHPMYDATLDCHVPDQCPVCKLIARIKTGRP